MSIDANIEFLEIDERVKKILKMRGINKLNPVQLEAVKKGLLNGKNLLLASPTGSGKTLIAELGIISFLLKNRGLKAVYVTPLRSLTSEKYQTLKVWEELGFRVAMSSGDYDSEDEWLQAYDIIVTTYEKIDSLWRHRPKWINDVRYFVLDELHYINDPERGPIIEAVAIRAKKYNLLALSATISNYNEIAKWLGAEPIYINWRPVPLIEGVIYPEGNKTFVIIYNNNKIMKIKGDNAIIAYTIESLKKNGQVLIFRNSRKMAENTAIEISKYINYFLLDLDYKELSKLSEEIKNIEDAGLNEINLLSSLVKKGVAYHHAGLSKSLRDIIEESFRKRLLKVIVATPTLAAGVNLPARTVIIGDIYRFNRKLLGFHEQISVMEYKQMSGRAGRPGYDEIGEAIIVAKSKEEANDLFRKYINSKPEPLESKLGSEKTFFSFVLGELSVLMEVNIKELYTHISQTLLPKTLVDRYFKKAIKWLSENEFINIIEEEVKLTRFGKRVADLYINPFTAQMYKEVLSRSEKGCDLAYLHLISMTPDSPQLYVSKKEIERIIEEVDCELFFEEPDEDTEEYYDFYSALKTSLILRDWIEEVDENQILEKYNIGSGDLRSIVESTDWLSYSAYNVAEILNLRDHYEKLKIINARIKDGVKEELLELVKVPYIGRKRARILYNNGIVNLSDIIHNQGKVKVLLGEKIGEKIIQEATRIYSRLYKG